MFSHYETETIFSHSRIKCKVSHSETDLVSHYETIGVSPMKTRLSVH